MSTKDQETIAALAALLQIAVDEWAINRCAQEGRECQGCGEWVNAYRKWNPDAHPDSCDVKKARELLEDLQASAPTEEPTENFDTPESDAQALESAYGPEDNGLNDSCDDY